MNGRLMLATASCLVVSLFSACARPAPPVRSGIDTSLFDTAVRPQDDFYRHVNGGWLSKTALPPDRASYGTFVQLSDTAEADLHALIQEAAGQTARQAGSTAQQVGDLFASFSNEARVNELGPAPVKPHLADIAALKTPAEMATLIGKLSMIGLPGPVGAGILPDAGDPTKTILYVSQGGTALPDRDYYLKPDARFVDIRAKYLQYLERMFTLADWPLPAAAAKAVLDVETALAKMQWTSVETRDAVKTYNKYQVTTLLADMPGFDWTAWAREQRLDKTTEWIVEEPSFVRGFSAMVPRTPLATWKSWLAAQMLRMNAPLLSQPFQDAQFEFFNTTLSGQQVQRLRWKRGVQLVGASMGEALGQLYVGKHFSPASKTKMEGLIANLVEAYRQSISELDWMTPATRQAALAKLAKFRSKVGYPDKWRDYSGLRIVADDLVGNVERANRLESDYQIAKLGKPVDHDEWEMTPQTVNAYYEPLKNEIVFPAAILQPPFFDPSADEAVNYGAIGAVIGHEIGHGFDDQGRRFDGDGKLRDWWTQQDEVEFTKRTKLLIDQFNAYSPLPDLHINGALTIGENIGDLGGLSIAYRAWRISLGGKPSPVIDGLTGDQRYFIGWAQAWRAKASDAYLQRQVLADPHAWAEFRVTGPVSNLQAFYDAFNVQPGDKLFRAPDARVKIW